MDARINTQPAAFNGVRKHLGKFVDWYRRLHTAAVERPQAVDIATIVLAILLDIFSDARYQSTEYPLALGLMLVGNASLFWRRRYPGLVLVFTVPILYFLASQYDTGLYGVALALYAWVVYGRNRPLVWVGAVAAFPATLFAESQLLSGEDSVITYLIEVTIAYVLIVGTADRAAQRRRYLNEVEDKLTRLETEQQLAIEIAAQEERARVAREMHDVVAHSVSVMLVQATAAKWVLDTSPEQSKDALENIETSGREALTDLRRVLGLLRETDTPDYFPNPTLSRIPELVETVRAAGHNATYVYEGNHVVPAGVQSTLYRITQEALTNVMKHAGPNVNVAVRVTTSATHANVSIVDDGRGAASETNPGTPRYGLVGMNERVNAFGGEFFTRPRVGGGFEVRASLPYLLPIDVSVQLAETTA